LSPAFVWNCSGI